MEIVTKLCDVEFARRAKAADFLGRAWEVLREAGAGDGDKVRPPRSPHESPLTPFPSPRKVLDSILAFYAALVARDPTDLLDLAAKSDFASTLHRMLASLEHFSDPLWLISTSAGTGELRAAGISKAEMTLVSVVCAVVIYPVAHIRIQLGGLQRLVRKKSGIFDEVEPVSIRYTTVVYQR